MLCVIRFETAHQQGAAMCAAICADRTTGSVDAHAHAQSVDGTMLDKSKIISGYINLKNDGKSAQNSMENQAGILVRDCWNTQ